MEEAHVKGRSAGAAAHRDIADLAISLPPPFMLPQPVPASAPRPRFFTTTDWMIGKGSGQTERAVSSAISIFVQQSGHTTGSSFFHESTVANHGTRP